MKLRQAYQLLWTYSTGLLMLACCPVLSVQNDPTLTGVIIGDKSYDDWGDLSHLTSYLMWEAGQSDKTLVSTAYTLVDCAVDKLCILVLTNPPYYLGSDLTNEMWIKDYNGPDGTANIEGNKEFIWNSDGTGRIGWEGCFSLTHFNRGDSKIQIHATYGDTVAGGGSTTSTGKNNKQSPAIKIDFTCDRNSTDDTCPNNPNKTSPGRCGCEAPDIDTDMDGTLDCFDNCTSDANKTSPGLCGCGHPDVDTDLDGTPDCNDGCPRDPSKTQPLNCGCGFAETLNCGDLCPDDTYKTAPGFCGCGRNEIDTDKDGTPDCIDVCPNDANKQTTTGICGCDTPDVDSDGDGVLDCIDVCPHDKNKIHDQGRCGCNKSEIDTDGGGTPDCIDQCPSDKNKIVPGVCGCNTPDVDTDGDGLMDCDDGCPADGHKNVSGVCGCGVEDVPNNEGGYYCKTVTFTTCSFTGDPHIATCDGMHYSCQGQGEFVMMQQGNRAIQARFIHFDPLRQWSVTRGIVVRDEGDTPTVQISEPMNALSSSSSYLMPRYVKKRSQYV